MSIRQRRYSKEELARRGTEAYEVNLRSQLSAAHHGKIVAIDVDSGQFEVAEDTLTAAQRLLTRCTDAQIWSVRIGHAAVHRFGPRLSSVQG